MIRRLPWLILALAGALVVLLVGDVGGIGLGAWLRGGAGPEVAKGPDPEGEEGDAPLELPDLGPRLAPAGPARGGAAGGEAGEGGFGAPAASASGAPQVRFGGLVKDPGGRPAGGVRVELVGPATVVAQTDETGRFAVTIEPGRYRLLLQGERFGALALPDALIDGATGIDGEFVLRETVRLAVTLRREGRGVIDAEVVLHPKSGVGGQTLRTDGGGSAVFEAVVAGAYWVVATLPNGGEVRHEIDCAADESLLLDVPPGVRVHGRVEDPEQGTLVVGAQIEIGTRSPAGTWHVVRGASAADGTYELLVPRGTVAHVSAVADGYAPWPVPQGLRRTLRTFSGVASGAEVGIDIGLERGLALEGSVTDPEREPVPGVALRFLPWRGPALAAETDEEGHYRVQGIRPGAYDVVVLTEGWFTETALRVTVPDLPSGGSFPYDFVVCPTIRLVGSVLQANGLPASGARVWVTGGGRLLKAAHGAGRDLETFSDASGTWRLTDLPPQQSVVLRAALGGLEATPRPLRTSQPPKEPIRLRLAPTVTVRGRVLDLVTQGAVAGARVLLMPKGAPSGRSPASVTTDEEGAFTAFDLIPGPWTLQPGHVAYLVAPATQRDLLPEEGEVEVTLLLDPGLVVAGIVVDPRGRVLAGASLFLDGTAGSGAQVRRSATSDARGSFRVTGLEPGAYQLAVRLAGYRNARVTDLRGGEDRLTVELAVNP